MFLPLVCCSEAQGLVGKKSFGNLVCPHVSEGIAICAICREFQVINFKDVGPMEGMYIFTIHILGVA
jgi:hypothetical protein